MTAFRWTQNRQGPNELTNDKGNREQNSESDSLFHLRPTEFLHVKRLLRGKEPAGSSDQNGEKGKDDQRGSPVLRRDQDKGYKQDDLCEEKELASEELLLERTSAGRMNA